MTTLEQDRQESSVQQCSQSSVAFVREVGCRRGDAIKGFVEKTARKLRVLEKHRGSGHDSVSLNSSPRKAPHAMQGGCHRSPARSVAFKVCTNHSGSCI